MNVQRILIYTERDGRMKRVHGAYAPLRRRSGTEAPALGGFALRTVRQRVYDYAPTAILPTDWSDR